MIIVEAYPEPLMPGDKDEPTSAKEAHGILLDALLDYSKAAPTSFWRTMKRLHIEVLGAKLDRPDISKLLCPHCGQGEPLFDALCPECDEELLRTL